jgi:hypothetical protein
MMKQVVTDSFEQQYRNFLRGVSRKIHGFGHDARLLEENRMQQLRNMRKKSVNVA